MKEENKSPQNQKKTKLFNLPVYQTKFISDNARQKGISENELIKRILDKEIEKKNG